MSFIKSIKRVFLFKFWCLRGLRDLKGLRGSLFLRHPPPIPGYTLSTENA